MRPWPSRANTNGTRSTPPSARLVASRPTRAAARRSSASAPSTGPPGGCVAARLAGARAVGLLGEPEHPLADDVALDLGGPAPDRLRAAEEERRLQRADGIVLGAPAPAHAGHGLLVVGAGEQLGLGADDVEGELHHLLVVLGPEHLVGRTERGHRALL